VDISAPGVEILSASAGAGDNRLAVAFPDLADNENYQSAVAALDDLEGAMAEGQEQLLVHNQLAKAAQGVAQGLDLEAQAPSAEVLDEAAAGFAALRGYLTGLAEAQPAVAEMEGYTAALDALDRLEATLAEIQDALLVSTQLDLLAQWLFIAYCPPQTLQAVVTLQIDGGVGESFL
jgi:uncharacterized phage infection (PIP) family protein YhgE